MAHISLTHDVACSSLEREKKAVANAIYEMNPSIKIEHIRVQNVRELKLESFKPRVVLEMQMN